MPQRPSRAAKSLAARQRMAPVARARPAREICVEVGVARARDVRARVRGASRPRDRCSVKRQSTMTQPGSSRCAASAAGVDQG